MATTKPANTPTTSLSNWKFQSQHVQQNLSGGDFIGSHSCIICATAPRLSDLAQGGNAFTNTDIGTDDLGSEFAIPIGVIDNAALNQDRQMAQIFEIGSKRSYLVASRTVGQMTIARVFYKGPNLLRMLYAFYPPDKMGAGAGDYGSNAAELELTDLPSNPDTKVRPIALDGNVAGLLPDIKDLPGYNNVILNLNSDLFSQPYGIVLYMKDNHDNDVAAVFLEECYIANHSMGLSANSVVVAENVTMRFERVVPIKVRVQTRSGIAAGIDTVRNLASAGYGALTSLLNPK